MLETPLVGRFQGEGRRITFSAPGPYHALVRGTAIAGVSMVLAPGLPVTLPVYPMWWVMIGTLLILAAIAAAFSLQMIAFDLRERTYRRRQGPGLIPRFTRGRLDELDAIVILAEPRPGIPPTVTLHMVLHWKGSREPIMVLQREVHGMPAGQPMNAGAGAMIQAGMRYAQALGVQFYDNSYFASPCPVPFWQ